MVDIPTRLNTAPMDRSIRKWFYRYISAQPLVLTYNCPVNSYDHEAQITPYTFCREAKNAVLASVDAGELRIKVR